MAAVDGVVRGEPLLGVRGRSLGVRGHLRLGVLAGEFDRVRMDVALLAPGEPAVGAKVDVYKRQAKHIPETCHTAPLA